MTVKKVFGKNESKEELDVTDNYGDVLLKAGKVSQIEYDQQQARTIQLLEKRN